jgi:hypothetical protein
MSKILKYIALITITTLTFWSAKSQESSIKSCDNFLNSGFVSDGQEYIAKPDENNKATFHTTFYGGSHYRVVACSDVEEIPLILTVFDTEKNLLFCNKSFDYTPYWDFTFTSTIDCIIEIEFDHEILIQNEVMLLIGFKEK